MGAPVSAELFAPMIFSRLHSACSTGALYGIVNDELDRRLAFLAPPPTLAAMPRPAISLRISRGRTTANRVAVTAAADAVSATITTEFGHSLCSLGSKSHGDTNSAV